MESPISSRLFEWLLADWSGHGDEAPEMFPSLREVSPHNLARELASALQGAGVSATEMGRRPREDTPPQRR